MIAPTTKPQLLYVADPMCSWCWGFSPVMSSLLDRFGDQVNVDVVVGGLRPGTTEPMTRSIQSTIQEHWHHVQDATGQPFDHHFFDRDGFVYDTEPAARAVVAARRLRATTALPFLDHLHAAFYRDNLDVTDPGVLCDLAVSFGFERAQFVDQLGQQAARAETRADFERAQALGVRGFPSLLAPLAERTVALTVGYQPWSSIEPAVAAWLQQVT